MTRKIPFLFLAAAALLAAPAALADDLVGSSCDVLVKLADKRAEEWASLVRKDVLHWSIGDRMLNGVLLPYKTSPWFLHTAVEKVRRSIPMHDYELAQGVAKLREQMAGSYDPRAQAVISASLAQIESGLSSIKSDFSSGGCGRYCSLQVDWDGYKLRVTVCGVATEAGGNEAEACGVVDLATREASYEIYYRTYGANMDTAAVVELGATPPAKAAHDKGVLAKILLKAREREYAGLPEACRQKPAPAAASLSTAEEASGPKVAAAQAASSGSDAGQPRGEAVEVR